MKSEPPHAGWCSCEMLESTLARALFGGSLDGFGEAGTVNLRRVQTLGQCPLLLALVLFGDQDVKRRDYQQRENRAQRHAGDDGDPDGIARGGAGAGDECQGKM